MDFCALSKLPEEERQELLEDLNYLNLAEIKTFCRRHSIPCRIAVATPDGSRRVTRDDDRKGVILDRVRRFLETGAISKETCLQASVVCFDPLPKQLTADDRLFYGQYDKTHRGMVEILKSLTGGRFESGAIARILARNFWSAGIAPTFGEFASAWLRASREHTKPNPEWAFLSDRAGKKPIADWKRLRKEKALKVLKALDRIT
ncbi:MAG: hypothetical protein ACRD3N_01005 [Terracidiphilus sp.]